MASMSALLRVLSCIVMAALAQNLKGSVELADAAAAVPETPTKDVIPAAQPEVSLDEDLPKRHPPTTNQAFVAIGLTFIIPALGLFVMKKSKDAGWEGAFSLICGLITLLWIYTAVLAFL
ncbi:Acetylxylan esterase [Durusdinium trenchii]|uniref:Acetylxylan esterase n=1 Tax=Durusdinium trenchii TaxID=1381693 RepID=A0ABP0NL06_9DINO